MNPSARIAITREVGDDLAACELSFVGRAPIDVSLARHQHQAYCEVLQALGCEMVRLPALRGFPDAVFVETPFSAPLRGIEAIRGYWIETPYHQSETTFTLCPR